MITTIAPKSIESLYNYMRTGNVAEVIDASHIRVRIQHDSRFVELWASFAMGNLSLPKVGDNVLVAGENFGAGYIIGHFPSAQSQPKQYTLTEDPESGKTILSVLKGDLDICSEKGSINLNAAKEINLESPLFELKSSKGNINIADTHFSGVHLTAGIANTKLIFGKLNSTVGRLIEKAKNVYRQVDNLNQVRAGRMRTIVNGAYNLKSERIIEKAEKDVRIDGNRINLG